MLVDSLEVPGGFRQRKLQTRDLSLQRFVLRAEVNFRLALRLNVALYPKGPKNSLRRASVLRGLTEFGNAEYTLSPVGGAGGTAGVVNCGGSVGVKLVTPIKDDSPKSI